MFCLHIYHKFTINLHANTLTHTICKPAQRIKDRALILHVYGVKTFACYFMLINSMKHEVSSKICQFHKFSNDRDRDKQSHHLYPNSKVWKVLGEGF